MSLNISWEINFPILKLPIPMLSIDMSTFLNKKGLAIVREALLLHHNYYTCYQSYTQGGSFDWFCWCLQLVVLGKFGLLYSGSVLEPLYWTKRKGRRACWTHLHASQLKLLGSQSASQLLHVGWCVCFNWLDPFRL